MRLENTLRAAALAVVALTVAACDPNKPFGDISGVRNLPLGDDRIVFNPEGFPTGAVRKARYLTPLQREDYALFQNGKPFAEGGAQAEILYATTLNGLEQTVLNFEMITEDTVETWNVFRGKKLSFEDSFEFKGELEMYLQPFTVVDADRQCIGFHAAFDRDGFDPRLRYDKHLFGYHCAAQGEKLPFRTALDLAGTIGVRGVTERTRISDLADGEPNHSQPLYVAVRDGDPLGQTGNASFPFEFLQFFSIGGGGRR